MAYCASVFQESGESAEGLHARALPLRVSALPTCCPAEGPNADCTLRSDCSLCSSLPSPPWLLFCRFLSRPHHPPQPATRHATVPHPNISSKTQCSAKLPPPNTGTHLSQPQSNTTEAMAVSYVLPLPFFLGAVVLLLKNGHVRRHMKSFYSFLSQFSPTEVCQCQ